MNKTVNFSPAWSLAFDTHWLKENLPRYLWRENEIALAVVQVEIPYIGESSKRVTVLYQIEMQDSAHATRRQMYAGYLVPAEQLAAEYDKMAVKAKIQPPCGRAAALVPEAAMILVAFPNDQKLHLLTEAWLQSWLTVHLHEVANGALDGLAWQVEEAKTEVLRYVPDKRCTTRCRVKLRAESGLAKEISFIAKQLADAEKARRQYDDLEALRKIWSGNGAASSDASKESVRFPRALAWEESNATVFIEEISGKNLQHALADVDLARVMPAVGGMLADFHRARKYVKKSVSRAGELDEVRGVIQTVAAALPELQSRLQRLFEQLEGGQWEDSPAVLLHGTFRLNHIFIDGEALALIDFDSLRMGHPAYDLANFFASLYYAEAQKRLEPAQRQNIVRYFIDGYTAKAPQPLPRERVLWFLTDLLLKKQMYKYLKHFHEDRAQKVEHMLALAEAAMAGQRQAPAEAGLETLWKMLP